MGLDGKGVLHTNSPFILFKLFPFSSKISTSIPKPAHCISPLNTSRLGLPRTKHDTISVPPLIDAK